MKKTTKWIIVAAVAAAIAAVTTLVVIALRARAKKRAWYDEEAAFGYDLDDETLDDVLADEAIAVEE